MAVVIVVVTVVVGVHMCRTEFYLVFISVVCTVIIVCRIASVMSTFHCAKNDAKRTPDQTKAGEKMPDFIKGYHSYWLSKEEQT